MKTWAFFPVVAVMFIFLTAGCGQGPVFPEDESYLSNAQQDAEPEKKQSEDTEGEFNELGERVERADPDLEREIVKEEKQQEEKKQQEEIKDEAIEDARKIADAISQYLFSKNFEKAAKILEENAEAIEIVVREESKHSDPEVGEDYGTWREQLGKLLELLRDDTLDPEKKKSKAFALLQSAAMAKRIADQKKIRE